MSNFFFTPSIHSLPPPLTPIRSSDDGSEATGSSGTRSSPDSSTSRSSADDASEMMTIVYEDEEGSFDIAAFDDDGIWQRHLASTDISSPGDSSKSSTSSCSSSSSGTTKEEKFVPLLSSSDPQRPSQIGTKPDYYYCDVKTCRSTTCLACCRGRAPGVTLSSTSNDDVATDGSSASSFLSSSNPPTVPAGPQWVSTANYMKPEQIRCMPDRWWEKENQYDTDSLFDLLSYVFGGFDLDTSIFTATTAGARGDGKGGNVNTSVPSDSDDDTVATPYGDTMASF